MVFSKHHNKPYTVTLTQLKIPFFFSIGELILNNNLQTFKDRPTVSYEVVNRWYSICFCWSHQPALFQHIQINSCLTAEFLVKTTLPMILQRNLYQSENRNMWFVNSWLFNVDIFLKTHKKNIKNNVAGLYWTFGGAVLSYQSPNSRWWSVQESYN